jgi:uncharacterized repeat protein (TIGR01451 family)
MVAMRFFLAGILVLVTAPIAARGTLAGTAITNQASVEVIAPDGSSTIVNSNIVTLNVDEILDVAISHDGSSDVIVGAGDINKPLPFTLTNKGNGSEAFLLDSNFAVSADEFDPLSPIVAFDIDSNGMYDAQVDVIYIRGQNDPLLAPEASIKLLLLGSIPATVLDTNRGLAQLTATAVTGYGPAGTSFSNAGATGVDAITGATTARAIAQGVYLASAVNTQFSKTQTVRDPDGGALPVSGAVITYQLSAQLNGTGAIKNVSIIDAIPAGTRYLPGTLKLNNQEISDVADTDAGVFASNEIRVVLGNLLAPALNTVTFQVKID